MGKNGSTPDGKEPEAGEEEAQDAPTEEVKEEKPADEIVKDADSIRKVIKVNQPEEKKDGEENIPKEEKKEEETPEPPAEPPKEEDDTTGKVAGDGDAGDDSSGGETTREGLEQKRAILQNIKDFDFQIKKNQEDVSGINQKLDGVSKDLDDLVSLYEIVSEQMNPFVGLSKVTKKRLDALESFTREIDILKERMGEMESFAERSGAKLKSISEGEIHAKTIDTDALLGKEGEETIDAAVLTEADGGEVKTPTEESNEETSEVATEVVPLNESDLPDETTEVLDETPASEITEDTIEETSEEFLDVNLDKIIEMSLETLSLDDRLDMFIDEFIESLKG